MTDKLKEALILLDESTCRMDFAIRAVDYIKKYKEHPNKELYRAARALPALIAVAKKMENALRHYQRGRGSSDTEYSYEALAAFEARKDSIEGGNRG